jgi:lipopolysaccharide O-acetyltransferase
MNANIADRVNPRRAIRFLKENGSYLFACELGRRVGVIFRRLMLAKKLRCPDITLGPGCFLRGLTHITIGRNFHAGEGLWLEAVSLHQSQVFSPSILIGHDVSISSWVHIAATHRIEIGDGVLIGSKVLITDHNHGQYRKGSEDTVIRPALRLLNQNESVVIGNNVWVGDGVVVMPGVTIGVGSVIGANSVVTRDVPPFTIVAGVPAVALRQFDSTTQEWRKL